MLTMIFAVIGPLALVILFILFLYQSRGKDIGRTTGILCFVMVVACAVGLWATRGIPQGGNPISENQLELHSVYEIVHTAHFRTFGRDYSTVITPDGSCKLVEVSQDWLPGFYKLEKKPGFDSRFELAPFSTTRPAKP